MEEEGQSDEASQDLGKLLAGEPVLASTVDWERKEAMEFQPVTKVNIGYIVMTILFNEHNQVLLVQEAKKSCRGTWYLPAGRMEPNENLVSGAMREVKEEAGLDCQITTMLSLHFGHATWIRVNFTGNITGGHLKTLAEKDEESLQAMFFDVQSVFSRKVDLRAPDVMDPIRQALAYRNSLTSVPLHPPLLPVVVGHRHLLHRFVLVVDLGQPQGIHMLVSGRGKPHLITCAIGPRDSSLHITVRAIVREAIVGETNHPALHGVLGVEHCGVGGGKDGLCITTLVSLTVPPEKGLPVLRDESYMWTPLTQEPSYSAVKNGLNGVIVKLIDKHA